MEDTLGPRSIEKIEHVSFVVNQTKQAPIEDEVHFITRCDNFMQIKNLRNEFFNEMLPKGYTDEKQYIMLMKMNSKDDNIKLAKFVCQLSKNRENIINRQKALLDSLSIMLD